jgi:hypothetical protein
MVAAIAGCWVAFEPAIQQVGHSRTYGNGNDLGGAGGVNAATVGLRANLVGVGAIYGPTTSALSVFPAAEAGALIHFCGAELRGSRS